MCGITGMIDTALDSASLHQSIDAMNQALTRRGPDDQGVWICSHSGLALGQRRLAVLELSELGHQPILSSSGRYAMTFNGEVYNFVELAKELALYRDDFVPTSDTQVMMAAFEQWGFEAALKRLDGMFAILCFDRQNKQLHLVRDRLGEKPLYFGCHENKLLFASELKAMMAVFDSPPEIDRQSLTGFLRHGYVPGPNSIYQHIYKLPPGTMLSIAMDEVPVYCQSPESLLSKLYRYWDLPLSSTRDSNMDVSQQGFESLLQEVVTRQMRADVSLGAFLSGGVDSSTIVAVMRSVSEHPVQTFSIGFDVEAYDESGYAKAVAKHLKTDHHEQILSGQQMMDIIPELAEIYDEPFADSSQLPTILVSKMARSRVTVCLSGDGGDELFGGYERYQWAIKLWKYIDVLPKKLRMPIAQVLLLGGSLDGRLLPSALRGPLSKIRRISRMVSQTDRRALYRMLISAHARPEQFVIDGSERAYGENSVALSEAPFLHQMMYLDLTHYLPDDILTKTDRASMYSSLELRAPLLDHRIVEYAWQMRFDAVESEQSKVVLRKLLYQHVPKELIERPKRGFAIPLAMWLRGPLKIWSEQYMNKLVLSRGALLNSDAILDTWNRFQHGEVGGEHFLWNVLMFAHWYECSSPAKV